MIDQVLFDANRAGEKMRNEQLREGRMIMKTGAEVEIDERELRQPSESALRALTVAMILLSGGLVAARMLNG